MARRPIALAFLLLAALPAGGATYVPVADGALVDQAPLIVSGTVEAVTPAPEAGGLAATDSTLRIERVMKGRGEEGGALTVRVPGGERPDGVGLAVSGAPRFAEGERVLLFLAPGELGHTLGLGHSCGDELSGPCDTGAKLGAVMRSTISFDNRGAALERDDRVGLAALYGTAPRGPLAPPSSLAALAATRTAVTLEWLDNSSAETGFVIEKKGPAGRFVRAAAVPAGRTTATVKGLAPGKTWVFRVRAKGRKGTSAPSEEVTVVTAR